MWEYVLSREWRLISWYGNLQSDRYSYSLRSVYSEDAIDISSVRRWVRRFESSEKDTGDRPRSALVKRFT
jgi:hypothetical protein